RRRHTRCYRDWSSDVCSSDLIERRAGTRQFHGGPIAAFIDIVGDFAVGMAVGGGVPTINLRIDYVRPAMGSALTATARVRRSGRTVALDDVDVHDEPQSLVAVGRGTCSPPRAEDRSRSPGHAVR